MYTQSHIHFLYRPGIALSSSESEMNDTWDLDPKTCTEGEMVDVYLDRSLTDSYRGILEREWLTPSGGVAGKASEKVTPPSRT